MEHRKRSVAKAVSYRIFATSLVMAVAFLFTGKAGSAAKIGLAAAAGKTALYYGWERLWSNIAWGLDAEVVE